MQRLLSVCILSLVLLQACRKIPRVPERSPEVVRVSPTMTAQVHSDEDHILSSIEFSDESTKESVFYGANGEFKGLLFEDFLSQNKQWVVLPREGPTLGFVFCKATDVVAALKDSSKFGTVKGEGLVAPNHYFRGWRGEATFVVELLAEGTPETWLVDLAASRASAEKSGSPIFSLKINGPH